MAATTLVTTLIQIGAKGRINFAPADEAGLAVIMLAAAVVLVIGIREDSRSLGRMTAPA